MAQKYTNNLVFWKIKQEK